MVEENNIMVKQREREINKLVQSITDLNLIFKELAGMVAEQGTVLDRWAFRMFKALDPIQMLIS